MVICANQVLRGAIQAMQQTLATLARERRLDALDPHIVPLEEIYKHVGVDEFKANEDAFLPAAAPAPPARSSSRRAPASRSLPLTEDRPKSMLDIKGRTILERQIDTLRACGVKDIAVVRGYKKDMVTVPGVRYYDNDRFAATGELGSLFAARARAARPVPLPLLATSCSSRRSWTSSCAPRPTSPSSSTAPGWTSATACCRSASRSTW